MTPSHPRSSRSTATLGVAAAAILLAGVAQFTGVTQLFGATSQGIPSASARTPDADPFDQLLGEWSGEGTLLGRPARFEMSWRSGAVPGVYRLSFSNGFVDPAAPADSPAQPVLSAEALYQQHSDGTVEGTWFDTRGVRIELEGEAQDRELRITWTAPTENGVTLYRVVADGVEVIDSVQAASGWREFGRAHYRRR